MILVDSEAEDRVDQSALIKIGLHDPIDQFSRPLLRQQVPSLYLGEYLSWKNVLWTLLAWWNHFVALVKAW